MNALATLFLSSLRCYGRGQLGAHTCVVTGCVIRLPPALVACGFRLAPHSDMRAPGPCGPVLLPAALALLVMSAALRVFEGGAGSRPPAGEPARDGLRRTLEEPRAAGRAWGPLPLGALYAVGILAFVLRRCLQGQEEAEVSSEDKSAEKELLRREEQLAQELAKTEQLLGGVLDQLDPLFERVDALAGAQQDLLTLRLHTISQLLKDKGLDTTLASQGTRTGQDSNSNRHQRRRGRGREFCTAPPVASETKTSPILRMYEEGLGLRCIPLFLPPPAFPLCACAHSSSLSPPPPGLCLGCSRWGE
ncbi:coiled-coil domain-containing protein 107 isoform X1 [Phascolarctos cinereus]|uniref:Coiled-coil domain-containing protein 107 isoform X1 n=1 Tax=Phascolarctos cinereus TaxID=38626 RepID=A0A6P5JH64_PHACI|nr:coiled-coil domain-containing protein 107 isoform X1 [Phascolarctos cinereus]